MWWVPATCGVVTVITKFVGVFVATIAGSVATVVRLNASGIGGWAGVPACAAGITVMVRAATTEASRARPHRNGLFDVFKAKSFARCG
ncbi:hypothetical protein GCM10010441_60230 [Kitasatospora paracochleata]